MPVMWCFTVCSSNNQKPDVYAFSVLRGNDFSPIGPCISTPIAHTCSMSFCLERNRIAVVHPMRTRVELRIHDAITGNMELKLKDRDFSKVVYPVFNHRGSRLLTADDGKVMLWDAESGHKLATWPFAGKVLDGSLSSFSFSYNDEFILGSKLRLFGCWKADSGELAHPLPYNLIR